MQPTTLIIRTAGTNCDRELAHAFALAGAATNTVHLNRVIDNPAMVDSFDLIGFAGGFSYGDDIAAGRIFANRLRHRLLEPIRNAIKCGVPMIGICNGFQVLVKMGLLPNPATPGTGDVQQATLADNTSGRFIARWVNLEVPDNTKCIWTQGLSKFSLPIAHAEGRFVPASNDLLGQWEAAGQIALRYAADDNPNGSVADIAGVCDPTGSILGLMPHPERCTDAKHLPDWSHRSAEQLAETPAGLAMFRNAVEHVVKRSQSQEQPATGVSSSMQAV